MILANGFGLAGLCLLAACAPAAPAVPAAATWPASASPTDVFLSASPSPDAMAVPSPISTVAPREEPASPSPTAAPSPRRVVAYFAGWSIDRNYHVSDVPADQLDHLNYAFATVTDQGVCVPMSPRVDRTNLPALRQLKARHPGLRTSLSIGGAARTNHFSEVVKTDAALKQFASSAVGLMRQGGFDGIDVDWEYPTASESHGFTRLLAELRRQLDLAESTEGTHHLLTIAAPAGPAHYTTLELGAIHPYLDWLGLMAYDFHGTWSTVTNFAAPLFSASNDPSPIAQRLAYNASAAVQAYLLAGVPPAKLVLGVPFFGSGWKGVPDVNDGLFQPAKGLPQGTSGPGIFAYRDLKSNYLGTYPRFWHDEAKAPWLYNATNGVMITYDDPDSLAAKADYVKSQNLGGMMVWELSTDDTQHSLTKAIRNHLG
ncbi:MAG: glycoside hydrolase family 18 protein [Chloroflexota bacterium]